MTLENSPPKSSTSLSDDRKRASARVCKMRSYILDIARGHRIMKAGQTIVHELVEGSKWQLKHPGIEILLLSMVGHMGRDVRIFSRLFVSRHD